VLLQRFEIIDLEPDIPADEGGKFSESYVAKNQKSFGSRGDVGMDDGPCSISFEELKIVALNAILSFAAAKTPGGCALLLSYAARCYGPARSQLHSRCLAVKKRSQT